jgi:biofilm protein TabA
MITGDIIINKNQIEGQSNVYFGKALDIISKTDFSAMDDGKFLVDGDNFFYVLITYKTKDNIAETKAETHKKYIDLHYIISGEEKIGFAGNWDPVLSDKDYSGENDAVLYDKTPDEIFLILNKGKFVIFDPGEIHRVCIANNEVQSVRKVVFKIKV